MDLDDETDHDIEDDEEEQGEDDDFGERKTTAAMDVSFTVPNVQVREFCMARFRTTDFVLEPQMVLWFVVLVVLHTLLVRGIAAMQNIFVCCFFFRASCSSFPLINLNFFRWNSSVNTSPQMENLQLPLRRWQIVTKVWLQHAIVARLMHLSIDRLID
jgi:hypothetical protein